MRGRARGKYKKDGTCVRLAYCEQWPAPGKKPFAYHQLMCSMKRRTSRHAPVLLLYPLLFVTSHVAHWLCTHRHTHTQIQTHNLSLKETLVIFSGKSVQAGKKETFKQAEFCSMFKTVLMAVRKVFWCFFLVVNSTVLSTVWGLSVLHKPDINTIWHIWEWLESQSCPASALSFTDAPLAEKSVLEGCSKTFSAKHHYVILMVANDVFFVIGLSLIQLNVIVNIAFTSTLLYITVHYPQA